MSAPPFDTSPMQPAELRQHMDRLGLDKAGLGRLLGLATQKGGECRTVRRWLDGHSRIDPPAAALVRLAVARHEMLDKASAIWMEMKARRVRHGVLGTDPLTSVEREKMAHQAEHDSEGNERYDELIQLPDRELARRYLQAMQDYVNSNM